MWFSTYKSSIRIPIDLFRPQVLKLRGFIDNFFMRNWGNGVWMWIPTDHRTGIYCGFFGTILGRWSTHNFHVEEYERTLLRRWGETPEAVRKNLSAEDQIRARYYMYYELYYVTLFKSKEEVYKPPGYDEVEE